MMLLPISELLLLLAVPISASPPHGHPGGPWGYQPESSETWDLKKFTSLVTFGDSYTDDSRFSYFASHNGSAPPVGWVDPPNNHSSTGGRPWPQYVKQYAYINNLYNYAVSGAVCSNDITPRTSATLHAPYPGLKEYEVPAFIADSEGGFLQVPPSETVYSIWIGTNDLGVLAFLTDSQVPGTTIVDYTDCVFAQLKRIYDYGGRYFVLQNNAPLHLAPIYATFENDGLQPGESNRYWPDKPANITEVSYRMLEQVVTVNRIFDLQTPFEVLIKKSMPKAKVAVMDVYGLISDIYYNPSEYLNGSAPLNVTGYVNSLCNATGQDCKPRESPDSFLWWDPLHPSEQTDRVIARTFVDVVRGTGGRWVRYWGG